MKMPAPRPTSVAVLPSTDRLVEVVGVSAFEIPGPSGAIPLRLYRRPWGAPVPVVLYFHGGGFVAGSLADADVPARAIASRCRVLVITVGYALAPRHPFPAAPEDAYAALSWAAANVHRLDGDPMRLAVAGDDAGGNLAAILPMIARDRLGPALAGQALIGPMLDPSMSRLGDPIRLNSDVTVQACAECYRQYLPRTLQRLHPYAAPLESSRLVGMPAAFIATAECDVLHNEAERYASELIAAGVHTQVARYAGLRHAELREHPSPLSDLAAFLRRTLRTD